MQKNPLNLILRLSLAFLWIWTAIVVLFLTPIEENLALMEPLGMPEQAAVILIWATALFELVLGAGLIANWRVREIALIQMMLIIVFTLIITLFLPEQWLHPFGPVSKNIPLLTATFILYRWETEKVKQRSSLYSFPDEMEV